MKSVLKLAFLLGLPAVLMAQTRLHLKAPPEAALAEASQQSSIPRRTEPVRRTAGGREHLLVEFDEDLTPGLIQELADRDVRLVQYVPDGGYILSARAGEDWSGLKLRARRLQPREKLSRALWVTLRPEETVYLLAEIFPDVDRFDGMRLAGEEGFQVIDHQDLLPNHLLLRGPLGRLERLASRDEVAYLFPTSDELLSGQEVIACPGAMTAYGGVGQYVAQVGEGWDGPGTGRASLGYYFQRLSSRLPAAQITPEILRAMQEWAKVVEISFAPVPGSNYSRTVNILFATGAHGDAYPFDGPGRVLAHTFYPSPPNPETIAGDMHLDDDEEWVTGESLSLRSVDVFSVVLHELGHALGLGHSDVPGSVMYPYYRRAIGLTAEDIQAIRELYAARVPEQGGTPVPEPPVGGSPQPPVDPLVLRIQSPSGSTVTTTASAIALSGTVTGGSGSVQVSWSNSQGGAGSASGSRSWSVSAVPLLPGLNVITVTATDQAGNRASAGIQVTRTLAADSTPPVLKITSPAGASVLASSATIRVAGTATDNVGVTSVVWSSSAGQSGVAAGTAQWSADVPLVVGGNTIVVRAYDAAGNSSWRSVSVTRR